MKRLLLCLILIGETLFAQTRKDSLLVFVGEKIEVKNLPETSTTDTLINGQDTVISVSTSMDSRFIAKYKILQLLNGAFKHDTIQFIVYDHYGEPAFSKFTTVLLFVSYNKGQLYHEKYQYFDLYLTTDNTWASPYSSADYNHPYKNDITVKPEKISFKDEVSFSVTNIATDVITTWYPKPYYTFKNGKAIAVYGNYVNDLFKLKQQTILKARGIY